uniref:Uncharacterized protein n=2 Tax=Vibrio TaxID=662 RepID=A0A0H3ZPS9_VIBSP|nr:putative cell-wall-anchored protein SasA (LPXTGmotif) [Vibrio cyclitrophicus]AKN38220.1 hypothetical protein [Vibrio splendidus]
MSNNKLAFLDVIKVIEKSSKAELQAIARVEKAIVKSGVERVVGETEKPRQSRRIDPRLGRAPRVEEPTTSSVSSDYAPAGSGSPMHQDTTSDPGEVVDENQATQENNIVVVVPEAKPNDAQKVESETASSSSVIDAPSVNVDTTVDNGAITDALEAQARVQARQASESARTNSLLDGIYRDQRGDIRQRSGAFATRQQKEMFEKQERAKANEENPEQSSLLRTISTWASNKMDNAAANSAVDAGGMAVGGSLWLAAKEVNDLAKDAESFLTENNLTSVEGVKAKAAETKEKAIKAKNAALNPIQAARRLLGRENSSSASSDSHSSSSSESAQGVESSQASSEVSNTQSTVTNTESERVESSSDRESSSSTASESHSSSSSESAQSAESSQSSSEVVDTQSGATSATSATTTNSERVESVESSQSGLSASDVRSRNNEPDNVDLVDALASQSEAQKEAAEDHGKKLDDIKKAIAASRGGEGGLLDMVDTDRKKRKGRKNKRGRKRGRNGRNVKPRRTPRAMSSVMETSGKSIGGKLAGSAATKGAGMAARGALRAVPLLGTLAMTAFDAVDGFTNEGKQREAFNVKDGDEVTTGQKSSMALANVLDMGGLVSGGLGLLGGGLESIGISGAAEALSFNSSDMARGIYGFFGGEDSSAREKESNAASSNETKQVARDELFVSNSTVEESDSVSSKPTRGASSTGVSLSSDSPVSSELSSTTSAEDYKSEPLVSKKEPDREGPAVIVNSDKVLNSTVQQLLEETKKANKANAGETGRNTTNKATHNNAVTVNSGAGGSIPTTPLSVNMQNVASDSE